MTKKRAFVAKALWLLVAAGLIFIGNFGIPPAITAQAGSEVVTFHVSPNPGLAEQSYILEFSLYQGTPALDYTDVPIDMDQNDSSAKTESYDRITPLSTIVTIIYRGNGHTGGTVPESQSLITPGSIHLRQQGSLVRTGYTFVGWRDGAGNIFAAGQLVHFPDPVAGTATLDAHWAPNVVTVTYNGNGHTSGTVPLGHTINTPGSFVTRQPGSMARTGHTFGGWRSATCGTIVAAGVTVNVTGSGTLRLDALWHQAPVVCPPLADISRGTAAQYLAMGIGWPLGNENNTENRNWNNITSRFGPRWGTYHLGIDIAQSNISGVPLLAVIDGTVAGVTLNGTASQGYHISILSNNLIDPATGLRLIFTYMHMQGPPTLLVNDPVTRGARVGRVGNSGSSTNYHLHFEVTNSGSIWGPDGGATGSLRNWHRVTRRINPIFFFPQGSFAGDTSVWTEVRGPQPTHAPLGNDIGMEVGQFRPLFYTLPGPFADLIGRDEYLEWILSRCPEERDNENVAVSFIRHFNISREAFAKANEQLRQNWESVGASPLDSSAYEIYPVDLIFTFDNELINEYFLWKNSTVFAERSLGPR